MKNKSLIAAALAAVSGAAFALESDTWLCQIALDVKTPDTVIALPLVSVGSTDASSETATISPADYVLTAGLAANDYMYAVINGSPKCWVVTSEGETLVWKSTKTTVNGVEYDGAGENDSVARGSALVLHVNGASSESTKTVYLYGQYSGAALTATAAAKGDAAHPVYTLMGNPNAEEVDLTAIPWGTKPAKNDRIAVPSAKGDGKTKEYICARDGDSVSWKDNTITVGSEGVPTISSKTLATDDVKFPAGSGFWYVSKGSTAATIEWPKSEVVVSDN